MTLTLLISLMLLAAEWRWPWRAPQRERWLANLALGGLSFVSVLALPTVSMMAAAHWASTQHFGLLHLVPLPGWAAVASSVLLLDCALYWQHRALHTGPLWRLHRVHHLDPMLDVTSGVRFHPFEAGISALYKSLVVALLGAPPAAAALSATLTLLASLFAHANIRLPWSFERVLRKVLITPGLHRIHHSQLSVETASNFGSVLSLWDALFGSARPQAQQGEALVLGVVDQRPLTRLPQMLVEPFKA